MFSKTETDREKQILWLRDSKPIFTSFGRDIYFSDFVNNAIDRVASEVSKIDIKSVVENGDLVSVQKDDITRLFRFKPNPLQTTSDFLSNVEWLRRKKYNAFIYKTYETIITPDGRTFKRYTGFYPLNPTSIYIGVNDAGIAEIKMDFSTDKGNLSYVFPYEELIHMRWRRGVNTIIGGGDDNGSANETGIYRAIDALDKTVQGLPKSIEASLQIKGLYAAKTLTDAEKMAKVRDDFESHIFSSARGIVATDLSGEFHPVNITPTEIPDGVMKFLKSNIEERYGVSAAILSGDYTGEQHGAFYQTAIEDFIVQFEQAFSYGVFSPREQDLGHRVKCYYARTAYMSTSDKLKLADLATKTRLMTLNQINEMFGVPPFESGNVRLQSLNYADAEIVNKYQLDNKEGDTDEPKDSE